MAWTPAPKEIDAVLKLKGPERYSYWVQKVADQEMVWSLWHEGGWALVGDDQEHECVPVWPHEKYAAACAVGDWAGFMPKPIEMDVFLTRWLPGIERDGRLVAVFPTPTVAAVVVDATKVAADLREELTKYE